VPLDPQIQTVLTVLEQAGSKGMASGTPDEARAAFRFMTVDLRDPASLKPVRSSEDTTYDAVDGPRAARVYRPVAEGPVPTVLFLHGGGFVIGDIETHDDHGRRICHDVGAVVASIDYRLAPEHPFPAGHDDCVAALRWVHAHIDDLGGDPTRVAVAGDSAGGNLSAAVAVAARDDGLPLKAQLLIYPGTDFVDSDIHASRTENAEGLFLTSEDMRWFGDQYLGGDAELALDPRASVLQVTDLAGVAPAVVGTGEYDPLRDEGNAYAAALQKAGVQVIAHQYPGLIHGFFGLGHVSTTADSATGELCADLKELLG